MTVHLRRRTVELLDADDTAHELVARVIAYNVAADVVDSPEHSETGDWDSYAEEFEPLSFAHQLAHRAAYSNVTLTDRHGGPPIGYALDFDDTPTELVGRFRVLPRAWADVATMIADNVTGVSGEFHFLKSRETRSKGRRLIRRRRAFVERVALEPVPAHPDSVVLTVRSGGPSTIGTPNRDRLAELVATRKATHHVHD